MTLEGKSPKEIEEEIKKQHFGMPGTKNENPFSNKNDKENNAEGPGIMNYFFSYFNDLNDESA